MRLHTIVGYALDPISGAVAIPARWECSCGCPFPVDGPEFSRHVRGSDDRELSTTAELLARIDKRKAMA